MSKSDNVIVGCMVALVVAAAFTVKAWVHDWDWRCVLAECRIEVPARSAAKEGR